MIKALLVICVGFVLSGVTTGCSVRPLAYNPVLGGFAKPKVYVGESVPIVLALDAKAQPEMKARLKSNPDEPEPREGEYLMADSD